jgi:hypothetical protein
MRRTFDVAADLETKNAHQQIASSALCRQQIAQDVAIIAELANLAVAFRLHRGDGDVNVVLVCFILFITIGHMQHISNIARMMQQYTQQKLKEALEQAQNNVKTEMIDVNDTFQFDVPYIPVVISGPFLKKIQSKDFINIIKKNSFFR